MYWSAPIVPYLPPSRLPPPRRSSQTGRTSVDSGSIKQPYLARRYTIAAGTADPLVINTTYAQDKEKDPNEPVFQLRRSSIESAPAFSKGSSMSKVVRGVKNITKGYSSVQVKVRNGTALHINHQLLARNTDLYQ